MTIGELRKALTAIPLDRDDEDIIVWLPGSRVNLEPDIIYYKKYKAFLIEGNLEPGSALDQLVC